jgi:hypothetical protein
MREIKNTGNAGYASRMLDGVVNSAIGFCFSIAPVLPPAASLSHLNKGPRLYQFSDSAVYPQIRKPSSLTGSSSSNSYRQRHAGLPGQSRRQRFAGVQCQPSSATEREFASFRPPLVLSSLESVHLIERGK